MKSFTHNDMEFSVENANGFWDISYRKPGGKPAFVGGCLYEGLPESEIEARARALIKAIFPVGIRVVGPDTVHPNMVGDLKIVGPDVIHPNFIYWDKESSSFPK